MSKTKMDSELLPWWKKTVVYQIYPRSYMDSTGNGIGDLKGIISKLDYIKDLGVETIWFSPFFKSPTDKPYKEHDCGYDISDYRDINPEYGNMDDLDELIKEIHSRGMKIVLDMVMNHTSIEHQWFKESRSSKDNPKRDWYIWRDGKKPNGKKPPNNLRPMIFLGGAWKYDPSTEQWYYHCFLPFQPDLNYRNPKVQKEMLDTVRFWLKKGADGFRLDIFNALFEDAEFRDAPFAFTLANQDFDLFFKSSKMTLNHPDTLEFCKTLRSTLDEFPDRFMVGEVGASKATLKKYLGDVTEDRTDTNGLNVIFDLQSTSTPMKAKKFKKLIELYEHWFPDPYMPTWVFGNHDQFRRISKIDNSVEQAKLNAALQLTARGMPYIYYGEEIGMRNAKIHKNESKDAVSHHFKIIPQFIRNFIVRFGVTMNRDECRTPMQWNSSENAGFSPPGVETWLPVNKTSDENNAEIEEKDPESLLNCYTRFLKARKETPALNSGNIEILKVKKSPKALLAYERKAIVNNEGQKAFIFLNFSKKNIRFRNPLKNPKILVSTSIKTEALEGDYLILTPWEGIVLLE